MANEGSVAPKERVNIVYKSHIGDQAEDVELPLKLLVVGDFTGKESEETVEDREPINVDKDNFNEVMGGMGLSLDMNVNDTLDEENEQIPVSLKFRSMADLAPDSVAQQVPELDAMLEMRKALLALKGPLGNVPAFRKAIQNILNDEETRNQIMQELGIND